MYRSLLGSADATFVPSAADVTSDRLEATTAAALLATTPMEQVARFAQLFYFADGAAYFSRVCQALQGADLAVINVLDHLAQAAAVQLAVPWIGWRSRPVPVGPRAAAEDSLLADCDAKLSDHIAQISGQPGYRVQTFRQRSPLLDLVAVSPSLVDPLPAATQSTPHAPGSREVHTGHWLPPVHEKPLPSAVSEFLAAAAPPIVFITFGTMPDPRGRADIVLHACRQAGVRALLQGVGGPAERSADHLCFAERVSYPTLLRRVQGVLHHGGAGTTHEVCRAGLPAFCLPHMGDQYYWAQRLTESGVGPPLLPHFQLAVPALAARLRWLVDNAAYQERTQQIQTQLAAEDGVAGAVQLIEELDPALAAPRAPK